MASSLRVAKLATYSSKDVIHRGRTCVGVELIFIARNRAKADPVCPSSRFIWKGNVETQGGKGNGVQIRGS